MKNLRRFFSLIVVLVGVTLGFTTPSAGKAAVSVAVDTDTVPAVGEELRININVAGGQSISGYGMLFIFDATALKYIETLPGDYLPEGGIMMAPVLTDDGSYAVKLDIAGSSIIDDPVRFGADNISVANMLSEVDVPDMILTEVGLPSGQYLRVSPFASAAPAFAPAGDGTLVTLTFEVIAAKPILAALLEINLTDPDDAPLETVIQDALITTQGKAIIVSTLTLQRSPADVNNDGFVNILDLTFVALQFGRPVTAANVTADVNEDKQIDILDLVKIAQHFGN